MKAATNNYTENDEFIGELLPVSGTISELLVIGRIQLVLDSSEQEPGKTMKTESPVPMHPA